MLCQATFPYLFTTQRCAFSCADLESSILPPPVHTHPHILTTAPVFQPFTRALMAQRAVLC